ncbi:MAG TPA: S-methyl-5-thioribose-1-phosphate isomerase [Thermoanaerobaculia bacterium]|nr:S-methyl-5-thioribose-1-phosphate isomerase [Thermoanaerobaculia bacterium]
MDRPLAPLVWRSDHLALLDQRLLPHREVWLTVRNAAETAERIATMAVRGAPAIGIAAAYGLALEARRTDLPPGSFRDRLHDAAATLRASRPTAVNLGWALDRMLALLEPAAGEPSSIARRLEQEAIRIHEEDVAANRRIGALGRDLLGDTATILTHCNAGALATGGYGTALGIVRAAVESGRKIAVFAGETRPWLQGARLTAWELARDGIAVTLITDGMAGHFFREGTFDAVIVGADRIAANGDTANKIGTYTLAVLASRHGIPFYVAAPISTVDLATPSGDAIAIEERSGDEVVEATGVNERGEPARVRLAPAGVAVRHPAFDVTPAELISAIITERGIIRAPFGEALRRAVASPG